MIQGLKVIAQEQEKKMLKEGQNRQMGPQPQTEKGPGQMKDRWLSVVPPEILIAQSIWGHWV